MLAIANAKLRLFVARRASKLIQEGGRLRAYSWHALHGKGQENETCAASDGAQGVPRQRLLRVEQGKVK